MSDSGWTLYNPEVDGMPKENPVYFMISWHEMLLISLEFDEMIG